VFWLARWVIQSLCSTGCLMYSIPFILHLPYHNLAVILPSFAFRLHYACSSEIHNDDVLSSLSLLFACFSALEISPIAHTRMEVVTHKDKTAFREGVTRNPHRRGQMGGCKLVRRCSSPSQSQLPQTEAAALRYVHTGAFPFLKSRMSIPCLFLISAPLE